MDISRRIRMMNEISSPLTRHLPSNPAGPNPEAIGRQRQGHGSPSSAGDAGPIRSHTLRTVPWVAARGDEGIEGNYDDAAFKTGGSSGSLIAKSSSQKRVPETNF